jgi:Ni/Co efflux regulator RcnB
MKKILSTVVAALVAVSFAAIVFAEDAPYSEHRDTAPAEIIRKDEPRRDEVKPMEKKIKRKKHHKQIKQKKQIREEEQHHQ